MTMASSIWALKFWRLKFTIKGEVVRGLPSINHPDQLFEECLLGKQFRTSFPNEPDSRAKKPLE